jgi:hypothetical protein
MHPAAIETRLNAYCKVLCSRQSLQFEIARPIEMTSCAYGEVRRINRLIALIYSSKDECSRRMLTSCYFKVRLCTFAVACSIRAKLS